jgi:hypothetical protein
MGWFSNQYDVLVVDYKVIIRQNLTYKRAFLGVFLACSIVGNSLILLVVTKVSPLVVGAFAVFLACLGGWLALRMKANGVIEIDNYKQTITLREKYEMKREDVVSIKIAEEQSTNKKNVYDYLSLASTTSGEPRVYKILRVKVNGKSERETETEQISRLIAETLQLKLIIIS